MSRLAVCLALFFAAPAGAADRPMSPDEFERYTTGKTLTYAENGIVYGIEEYRPGRRVRWSVAEDDCREGIWFEADGLICFAYEDEPGSHCWSFIETGSGLIARFEGGEDGRELYEAQQTDEPLICPGPDIGV